MLRRPPHTRPAHRIAALAIACSLVASVLHRRRAVAIDAPDRHDHRAGGRRHRDFAHLPRARSVLHTCLAVAPDLAQTGRFYPTFGAYNAKHVYAAGEAVDQIELLQVSYTDCGWNYSGSITLKVYGPNAPEPTPTRKRIAELHVPATGERVETRPLTDGHEYTLVASGTATLNASTGLQADAEYGRTANGHFANECKLGGVDHDIGVWILAYPKDTTQRFFPIWGAYEKGERYETAWIATSDTNDRLMLAFHECKPADNTGYITVQVYG